MIVLMVLLVTYKGGFKSYEPEDETVQFILGQELSYDKSAVFSVEGNTLTIKDKTGESTMETYPIVHKNSEGRKLTISENMLYTDPFYNESYSRLNYFTSVSLVDGLVVIEKDGKTDVVSGGYLFNGVNTYVFLEDATLKIGVNKVAVPALSYMVADYRQEVQLYNSVTKSCEYYYLGGMDSLVEVEDKYTIDVGRDVYIMNDKESLIFTAVDGLDVLELR